MTFLSEQLVTRSSLYEKKSIITIQLAFEGLPFCVSDDSYDIDAHTFSAYGTSTDGLIYLRRPKRLVVQSKKARKAAVLRMTWPDPRNATEVASFHQKYLASLRDTSPMQNTHTVYTHLPQSVNCTPSRSTVKSSSTTTSRKAIPTSSRIWRCVMPPPRFVRHVNEA